MPTISDLVARSGLDLVLLAGERGSGAPIRWVHTSELPDPAPWLSGGELLLTTGMGLSGDPEVQGAYLERLVSARVAGLGFGFGFGFDIVPEALAAPADECGFPILGVPYRTPFIAISEWVSARLAEDRLEEAQATVSVHERLADLVAAGSGPADVLDEVAALTGGWATLFDLRGGVIARAHGPGISVPDDRRVFGALPEALLEVRGPAASSELSPQGAQVGTAVMAGKRQEGVLVFGHNRRLGPLDRIVVRHATTVLGLLLSSRRAVIDAQRRVTGDIISEGFTGRLARGDLERRLELVGFRAGVEVTALVLEPTGATGDDALGDEALDGYASAVDDWLGLHCAGGVRTAVLGERVAALVQHEAPAVLAESLQAEFGAGRWQGHVRVGVGETVAPGSMRRSYLSALFALRAAPDERLVAGPRDLGSYGFLMGTQSQMALESFVKSVLGPLIRRDSARSSDLVASVRAYIEAGGRWEAGAAALGVHRHTLRYRVRQAEELLGRDLAVGENRLELWLALKAQEILRE
ncbi:MAG: PucR family transcriptional regulator ligand-binding domain-containing protein [Actinomycetota bacterium]|nr:PucR family transcriptional regulator ligand-binding domain-containing protein [Actinomycetota bacterium]